MEKKSFVSSIISIVIIIFLIVVCYILGSNCLESFGMTFDIKKTHVIIFLGVEFLGAMLLMGLVFISLALVKLYDEIKSIFFG